MYHKAVEANPDVFRHGKAVTKVPGMSQIISRPKTCVTRLLQRIPIYSLMNRLKDIDELLREDKVE